MHCHNEDELRISSRTLSEVVTIFVFLVVGAALPFATLADNWAPSLAVVAVLLLVARPVAVLACTLPDRRARWTRGELAFLCWTRETGVVPAALVGVLAGLGVPNVDLLAGVVALAIVATLLLQAAPAPWLARRLGLLDPAPTRSRLTAATLPVLASTRTVVSLRVARRRPAPGTENDTAQNGRPLRPWRTSRTCVRSGVKPASGRAIAIARSFEKRIWDCWQLCAAKIVTPSSSDERQHAAPGDPRGPLRRLLRRRVDAYADRPLLHGLRRYGMRGQAV